MEAGVTTSHQTKKESIPYYCDILMESSESKKERKEEACQGYFRVQLMLIMLCGYRMKYQPVEIQFLRSVISTIGE